MSKFIEGVCSNCGRPITEVANCLSQMPLCDECDADKRHFEQAEALDGIE